MLSSVSTAVQPPSITRRSSWIQIGSHIDALYGGVTASVPRLSAATEASGAFHSPIVGFCHPDEIPVDPSANVSRFPRGRLRWMTDSNLRSQLRTLIAASDGLHIHGIWEEHCATAAAMASSIGKPYIVSAHGMLETWAMQSKGLKKALYSLLIEKRNLSRASCLRALTRNEVDDYRRFGMRNPIAVIPNGVEPQISSPGLFFDKHPSLSGSRVVLFMSRLIHKKGLDLLCRAWAAISPSFKNVHLVIAGPDDGARTGVERLVDELGIRPSVTFAGMLSGPLKWSALAAAEVFVLPSRSEGFSIAALEAIAAGVPVILTRQCNFPEAASAECGWVIEPDVKQLQGALEDCLRTTAIEKTRMGERGRTLAANRYSWPAIGSQMGEVYKWVLGGPEPASVEIF